MTQKYGLIIILDCLYGLNPTLCTEYYNMNPPMPINNVKNLRNFWRDGERRLESKVLNARKMKSAMKIIKTWGKIYFARK